jgi:hypothetical protein
MVLESECFHGVGAFEVHLLKVSALKLSHPSVCSVFQNFSRFSLLRPSLFGKRGKGKGYFKYFLIGFGDFFIVFTNSADSDMGLCV